MKFYILISIFMLFSCREASAETLCAKDETIYFSCITGSKNKSVSLCGSKDLTRDTGSIRYLFGTKEKIELSYPDDPSTSRENMFIGSISRGIASGNHALTHVYFKNGSVSYDVFSRFDGEAPDTQKAETYGVTVILPDNTEKNILCTAEITDNLQDLIGILTCDPDMVDCAQ